MRIEFAGALYQVTSRGDEREVIFLSNEDSHQFLGVPSEFLHDFNWAVYAYCLMDNYYHLLIETQERVTTGVRSCYLPYVGIAF